MQACINCNGTFGCTSKNILGIAKCLPSKQYSLANGQNVCEKNVHRRTKNEKMKMKDREKRKIWREKFRDSLEKRVRERANESVILQI